MSPVALRPYRGLDDIPGMGTANARLRRLAGILDPIDIEAMVHRYTHLVNSDPLVDCMLAEDRGTTVGYARVEWHDLEDGDRLFDITSVVDPAVWGHGVTDALLDWGERRVRDVARTLPVDRRSWYGNWVFEGDTELEHAMVLRGYQAVRWGAEMLRPDLEAIDDAPPAPGYVLRSPEVAELPAVFAMVVEAFREHWGEYDAADQRLDEWTDDPRFRRDLVVVAWHGAQPAACVTNVLTPSPDGAVRGLLASVATHPGHRRRGLARAAISESLRRLRAAGATSAYLGVDTDNHNRAVELYEACGFRVASSTTTWRRPLEADLAEGIE
jgi:mycothiol synthase